MNIEEAHDLRSRFRTRLEGLKKVGGRETSLLAEDEEKLGFKLPFQKSFTRWAAKGMKRETGDALARLMGDAPDLVRKTNVRDDQLIFEDLRPEARMAFDEIHDTLARSPHQKVLFEPENAARAIKGIMTVRGAKIPGRTTRTALRPMSGIKKELEAFNPEMPEKGKWLRFAQGVGAIGTAGLAAAAIMPQITSPDKDFKRLIAQDPGLIGHPIPKLRQRFDTLRKIAPDVAKQPELATGFLRQTMQFDTLDYPTAKAVLDIQKELSTNRDKATQVLTSAVLKDLFTPAP